MRVNSFTSARIAERFCDRVRGIAVFSVLMARSPVRHTILWRAESEEMRGEWRIPMPQL